MKQGTIILAIFLFLTSCSFKSVEDYLNEAAKLSEQNKFEEAIELLDKAIEKDPKYLGAYINRGADKSALEKYKEAIMDYERVLDLDPKNTLALYNIGNVYKRLGNDKTAISFYDRALDTKGGETLQIDFIPNDFVDLSAFDVRSYEIQYERAIAFYNIDSLQRAFDGFNAAIRQDYMTAESYCWLGYIYLATRQTDVACDRFRKSKQLGSIDAENALEKYCNGNNAEK